jgi:hypothetical protein
MLVPHGDKRNNLLTIAYPRCDVAETLQGGGYCELSGKIGFKGLVLCERHAKVLEAQDRTDLLEGIVSSLGLCLIEEHPPAQKQGPLYGGANTPSTGDPRTCSRPRRSETGHGEVLVVGSCAR